MPFLSWLKASITPLIGLVSLALCAEVAQAENLHRKYGPGWDCRNLHPSLGDDVFKTCKKCESENQEFDLDGGVGKCVPKADQTDDKTPPVDPAKKNKPVPEEVYVEGSGQCGQPEAADKTCLWNGINCYRWGGPKIAG